MRILGTLLVVLGIVALVYGGIGYTQRRTIFQVGDVKATATEHHRIPLSPAIGVVSLVLGIGLIVTDRRRGARA